VAGTIPLGSWRQVFRPWGHRGDTSMLYSHAARHSRSPTRPLDIPPPPPFLPSPPPLPPPSPFFSPSSILLPPPSFLPPLSVSLSPFLPLPLHSPLSPSPLPVLSTLPLCWSRPVVHWLRGTNVYRQGLSFTLDSWFQPFTTDKPLGVWFHPLIVYNPRNLVS